jgi:hypothetical protein
MRARILEVSFRERYFNAHSSFGFWAKLSSASNVWFVFEMFLSHAALSLGIYSLNQSVKEHYCPILSHFYF